MVAGNVVLVFSLQAVLHGLVEVGLTLLVDHLSLKNTRAKYQFQRCDETDKQRSSRKFVRGSDFATNSASDFLHWYFQAVLRIRMRDPGSSVFMIPGSGIRNGQKNQEPDPWWTSQIIFPRAYKQFLGEFFGGSGSGIRDGKFGSGIPG
jgi:hypothetical protein